MNRPPTDLEILEEIYKRYYAAFAAYSRESPSRETKVYVPIDIRALAEHFKIDGDIIHGRLYYHLDQKFGFTKCDGTPVPFFWFRENQPEPHQVQFPMLAAAIAALRDERNKFLWATWLAGASLILSIIALAVSVLGKHVHV
jgi:hypothetical protein